MMWQSGFSQPQAFSQQAAGAGCAASGLRKQAGAGAQQAGFAQQAGSGAQQAFTGPQVSHAPQCLQANRSFRPANRSLQA